MKNYFKYFFSRLEHWLIILIMFLVMIGAYFHSNDLRMFFFLIPIGVMIARSVHMYKEKKNGTTS